MTGTRDPAELRFAALTVTLGITATSWVVAVPRMREMSMGAGTPLAHFLAMWLPMMAAMMLPGAAWAVVRRARATGHLRAVLGFVGSYLALWTLVGVMVYPLYRPYDSVVAGAAAVAAGAYELSPLKRRLRRRCTEGARTGTAFGLSCVGSNLGLLAMLMALGLMSVTWMVAITIVDLTQKALPTRASVDVTVALVIVAAGVVTTLAPSVHLS